MHPFNPSIVHRRECFPCNRIAWLSRATPESVERELHRGGIAEDEFEAYMHVWATGAARFSSLGAGWTDPPTSPNVIAIAAKLRAALSLIST